MAADIRRKQMSSVRVMLPTPKSAAVQWRGTTRTHSVAGERVAIVNNGWGSGDDLVDAFERILRDEYDVADVKHFRANHERKSAAPGDDAELFARIADWADSAVTMLGNCGGCTAWTCEASAALERHGVSSGAVVTGLFRPLAEFALANQNKTPEHPLVVLEDRFEFATQQGIEDSARLTLRSLFGEGSAASREESAASVAV
jgi:hypothetical protein